VNITTNRSFYI